MLATGPDIDAVDNDGRTALIWATGKAHLSVVEMLLIWGADSSIADHSGKTALMHAKELGFKDVAGVLAENAR